MRRFGFAGVLRKYEQSYDVVRPGSGIRNDDGDWIPATPERTSYRGSIQPVSARLRAAEGGIYTESDRMLYTTAQHATGDIVEVSGVQYKVDEVTERAYSDVNQYLLRKVVANAPVQGN
ncbi:hypothetical protein [Paenibacillus rhizophilus]|uniref:Head-tail adaptor protein n=1 Tax=Paenibacillus rhizophilus TaxID=1850366 RepID=A0A3N9P6I1_9BACL|nr:hypothetical protein [Paenibacillus rhizophilus]RQW11841.1 hypothetical protein EH198_09190 [Paenibacillus rhizophilus]